MEEVLRVVEQEVSSQESDLLLLFEVASLSDTISEVVLLKLVEDLVFQERERVGVLCSLPSFPRIVERYEKWVELFSVGEPQVVSLAASLSSCQLTLQGKVVTLQGSGVALDIAYSVGVSHEPVPYVQRWQWGIERWEVLPFPPGYKPRWIAQYFIRYFWVHDGRLFLFLLPRAWRSPVFCRIVVLEAIGSSVEEVVTSDIVCGFDTYDWADSFGRIDVGHAFVAFCRLGDFLLFNLKERSWERYRAIYLSEQYRRLVRSRRDRVFFPMVVSEGILLLPVGVFFDLETYYQLPSIQLSADADYRIGRSGHLLLFQVPSDIHLGSANIVSAYRWVGLEEGFQRLPIRSEIRYAPFGQGSYWSNSYVCYGADSADLDERRLYTYKVDNGALWVEPLPLPSLPLSSLALLVRFLPSYATSRWLEQYFQVVTNGEWLYTVRLWNRIYRFKPSGEWELAFTVPVRVGEDYEYLVPEMPCQTLLAYDIVRGQLYAVMRYGDSDDVTICRQELRVTSPPVPTIENVNWVDGYLTFVPAVYGHPQEFVVEVVNLRGEVQYEVLSWVDRRLWSVSVDGGITWRPLEGPVLRRDASQQVKIRLALTFLPLKGETYTFRVRSYSSSS